MTARREAYQKNCFWQIVGPLLRPPSHDGEENATHDSTVRSVAREFFGRTKTTMPFDPDVFKATVQAYWSYHSLCEQVRWRVVQDYDGEPR